MEEHFRLRYLKRSLWRYILAEAVARGVSLSECYQSVPVPSIVHSQLQ